MLVFLVLCLLGNEVLSSEPVRLFVKEVPLKVLEKEVTVVAIEQADGTQGYFPEKAEGSHVAVVNQLKVQRASTGTGSYYRILWMEFRL